MKRAKIILFFLAAVMCLCLPENKTYASAETPSADFYARADARDIYFCEDKDISTAMFTIPYTYCVRVLATENEWYYVRYAEDTGLYSSVDGYCLKENLTPVSVPPENVYLNKTVSLNLSPHAPTNGSFPVSNVLTVTAAFYGSYSMGGAEYSCVAYNGKFYYQLGVDDYPLNELPAPPEPAAPKKKGANAKLIIALSLTALAAAALIILYFTGRHKKFARTDS